MASIGYRALATLELTKKIARLTALIQPVVIFIMAGLVGVVAYSIITGIFQAISGLRTS